MNITIIMLYLTAKTLIFGYQNRIEEIDSSLKKNTLLMTSMFHKSITYLMVVIPLDTIKKFWKKCRLQAEDIIAVRPESLPFLLVHLMEWISTSELSKQTRNKLYVLYRLVLSNKYNKMCIRQNLHKSQPPGPWEIRSARDS